MRMKNRLIVGAAFAAALLAGAAVPLGGAQATVVYSEDFNSALFQGSLYNQALGDNFNDKYTTVDLYTINDGIDGWHFTVAPGGLVGPTFVNVTTSGPVGGAVVLNENAGGGSASKTVTGLNANTTYQLSFLVYGDNRPGQTWGLNVKANSSILNLSGVDQLAGTNPGTIETLLFTTDGTGSATLVFLETTASGEASPIIDNVEISQTPLPSTWLMMLSGFVGLGFFAYRGTKKNSASLAAA